MRIGVPGEFHEDRWQQTAEDSERCVIPRTREAGGAHRIQVIAWRRGLLDGLRHDHPTHRYSRGIPAWRMGLLTALRHGDLAHRCFRGILAWRRGLLDGLRHDHPAHRYLSGIPAWQRTNTDRPSARIPCPQLPQGHPGVAKSHLTKDKPVSARCKVQLSYCRAYRQTYRMVSYVGLSDHQTGPPYRPALPEALAGRVTWVILTAHLTDGFRQPDFSNSRPPDLPDGFIRRVTDRQTGLPYRQVSFQRPHRPPSPAIHPGKGPAGLP